MGVRDLGQGPVEDLNVIGGGVRPGPPGAQQPRQRFPGSVEKALCRVPDCAAFGAEVGALQSFCCWKRGIIRSVGGSEGVEEGEDRVAGLVGAGRTLARARANRDHTDLPARRNRAWTSTSLVTKHAITAGLKAVTPHVLRHTAAMQLLHAGVDVAVIQRSLFDGHVASAVTRWNG
jgi:hypothetical protein